MKLNHPPVILWNDPTANISMVHQSGAILDEAPKGANFSARFAQPAEDGYIRGRWGVSSACGSISGHGTFTIRCNQPHAGDMGSLFDYDGAFDFPHQIAERLMALGYHVGDEYLPRKKETADDISASYTADGHPYRGRYESDEMDDRMSDDDRMDMYDSIEDNNPSGRDLPDRNEDNEPLNGGGYMA